MEKGITDEVLAQLIGQELDSADSWANNDLAEQQSEALDYYYGKPFGV